MRLILWNVGGGIPGETDMASQGQPAKYLFCAAENREQSPWQPLHVERGFAESDSTVTVFACQSPHPLRMLGNAERILRLIAASIPVPAVNMFHAAGQFLLSFGARPGARSVARAGASSKASRREEVGVGARALRGRLAARRSGILAEEQLHALLGPRRARRARPRDPERRHTLLPMVRDVGMIHVAVIGGDLQWWMGFSPGWGNYGGYAVTKAIRRPK